MQILHFAPVDPMAWQCAGRPAVAMELGSPLWTRSCRYIAKEQKMLLTICVILLVLWALGMATSYTASGLIHILLVIGLVVLVIRLVQGRRIIS